MSRDQLNVEQALNSAQRKPVPDGWWKALINCFIGLYFFAVLGWLTDEVAFGTREVYNLPFYDQWRNGHGDSLLRYFSCFHICNLFGWYQFWGVFAPDPRHMNFHESAVVTYADGTLRLYEFPRMEMYDYYEKFKHEKLRKIFSDNLPWNHAPALPPTAVYFANAFSDPNNEPVMFTMIREECQTPPPDENNWNYRGTPMRHLFKGITFIYQVRPGDYYK